MVLAQIQRATGAVETGELGGDQRTEGTEQGQITGVDCEYDLMA